MSRAFISTLDTALSAKYRDEKNGENNGLIEHTNGTEINLEYVIIAFNHRFSVFNVCCGPRSILMPDADINIDLWPQQT